MAIEIKQLLIKSNIVQSNEVEHNHGVLFEDRDMLKEEIMLECRYLIHEILNEKEER